MRPSSVTSVMLLFTILEKRTIWYHRVLKVSSVRLKLFGKPGASRRIVETRRFEGQAKQVYSLLLLQKALRLPARTTYVVPASEVIHNEISRDSIAASSCCMSGYSMSPILRNSARHALHACNLLFRGRHVRCMTCAREKSQTQQTFLRSSVGRASDC